MITSENLENFLLARSFAQISNGFAKSYADGAMIMVNMADNRIEYPIDHGFIVHDKTTSNFDDNENFVVLDCVDRLLEIGYPPSSIEIEPRWTLGHTQKSGKADIGVRDRAGDMYLIVECKTAGSEYTRFSSKLFSDGGQLFSYWQQETKTRWLLLYASDYTNDRAIYEGIAISCSASTLPDYQRAGSAAERFALWKSKLDCAHLGADSIFGVNAEAYEINEEPFTKSKLKDLTPENKGLFIRSFEEILRHNSISDKENAFNKLVVLLICKLVDELEKGDEETLDFQVKQSDTYELLQDRLQMLYKKGMDSFLNEDIYYLDLDYPTNLVTQYKGASRRKLIQELQSTIRKLKFFTNNDFAFKDVHNDRLFEENGAILFEMVNLIQQYRIVYPSRHQILGDLFETLLDSGFKQDEGQFFTPMPITRFVWDCIPETLLSDGKSFPKFIDFACGSGHFLNEGVYLLDEINQSEDNSWCSEKVYGIEKDDRLARVSKVSMLMNGVLSSNIINGDGLALHTAIENGTFDIVVSNPPYSVSSFKSYLSESIVKRLSLAASITDSGNQIESLFLERACELLRPGGLCMIILPTSILSKTDATSIATRKFMLQRFVIRAIINLGTSTFHETGTPTSIIALRKRHEPPQEWELYHDSADDAISNTNPEWEGSDELRSYAECTNQNYEAISNLINNVSEWWLSFDVDQSGFRDSTDKIVPNKLARVRKALIESISESFYYFLLSRNTYVAYIQSPSQSKAQEKFLGYKWSNSRSGKGLRSLERDSILDGYTSRAPEGTVARFVKDTISGSVSTDSLPKYSKLLELTSMIDFTDDTFVIDGEPRIEIAWSYPTVELKTLCRSMTIGATPLTSNPRLYEGDVQWAKIEDIKNAIEDNESHLGLTSTTISEGAISQNKALSKDTLIMSFKLTIGLCAFTTADTTFTNEAIVALVPHDDIDKDYLFCLISSGALPLIPKGTKKIGKSFSLRTLKRIHIPNPPREVKEKIISKYLKRDHKWRSGKKDTAKKGIFCTLSTDDEWKRVQELLKADD